jgi:hypothetical protein
LSATPGVVGCPPALGELVLPVLTGSLGYDADRGSELVASGAFE